MADPLGFTPEQVSERSVLNFWGFVAAGLKQAAAAGRTPQEYFRSVGADFAPGWAGTSGAHEFMVDALLNVVSTGGAVLSVELDPDHAEAMVELPQTAFEAARFVGLPPAVMLQVHEVLFPIAEFLGLAFDFHSHGAHQHLTVSRPAQP